MLRYTSNTETNRNQSCFSNHSARALSSVNIRLNISNVLQTGFETFAGYRLGQKIGFPQIGAVAGLVSSAINISYNRSLKVKGLPDNLKDYAYLFYAKKEII